jgi:hypothetical protein
MANPRDTVLHPTPIADLRPTQMTVGLREVGRKRESWRAKDADGKVKTLQSHMVPVVLGPDGGRYITDHHHLARALWDDGQREVFVMVVGDLSKAEPDYFWTLMDYHGWTHPYDAKGRRRDYEDLPRTVAELEDDPYRSLAGALRQIGGFAKDATPFSEFVWADFFRPLIKRKDLAGEGFEAKLKFAYEKAKSGDADFLPGWCGPQSAKAPRKSGAKAKRR